MLDKNYYIISTLGIDEEIINIFKIIEEKIKGKNQSEKELIVINELENRKIFPIIEEEKLVFNKICYNFDDDFFKYLDEKLGIMHKNIEEYSDIKEKTYLLDMFGINKLEEKIIGYYEFVELADKNSEYQKFFKMMSNSYSRNIKKYKFKIITYIEHPKIYLIIKSMIDSFDLSKIYLNLCQFLYLDNNLLNDKTYLYQVCKDFNKKEKNLSIGEKKELINLIYSKINIDKITEFDLNIDNEIINICKDIAKRNTNILNTQVFRSILNYNEIEPQKILEK